MPRQEAINAYVAPVVSLLQVRLGRLGVRGQPALRMRDTSS
jgi:hypothetical protein